MKHLALIALLCCAAMLPPTPGAVKASRHKATPPPTQGSGAMALLSKAVVAPPAYLWPPFYFAATATDSAGQTSSNSVAVSWTNTLALRAKTITLAWDRSPGTNSITNYAVLKGRAPNTYTNVYFAGTNLTLTVPLYPPAPTNLLVVLTSMNATNLQWCSALGKPWTLLGATNYTATNPPMRMWRGVGKSVVNPSKLTLTVTRF